MGPMNIETLTSMVTVNDKHAQADRDQLPSGVDEVRGELHEAAFGPRGPQIGGEGEVLDALELLLHCRWCWRLKW